MSLYLLATLHPAQEAVGLLSCKGAMVIRGQWSVQHNAFSAELLCKAWKAAFQPPDTQTLLVDRVTPPQGQDMAFPCAEHAEIPVGPFLQSVKVPLISSAALWHVNNSSQFFFFSRGLADGALCPIIQVIYEDAKQYWPCYWSCGYLLGSG